MAESRPTIFKQIAWCVLGNLGEGRRLCHGAFGRVEGDTEPFHGLAAAGQSIGAGRNLHFQKRFESSDFRSGFVGQGERRKTPGLDQHFCIDRHFRGEARQAVGIGKPSHGIRSGVKREAATDHDDADPGNNLGKILGHLKNCCRAGGYGTNGERDHQHWRRYLPTVREESI